MSEPFVPLPPLAAPQHDTTFISIHTKALPEETHTKHDMEQMLAASADPSLSPAPGTKQPAITLKRDGDTVTSIRVQCGCGRVIELNCVY